MKLQTTIRTAVELETETLFNGKRSKIRLLPADPNSGISFVRVDLPTKPVIKINPLATQHKMRSTSAVNGEVEVNCIEHLLSAIGGIGVDNLQIEINSSEVPWGDGSSRPFVELLTKAGLHEQKEQRKSISLLEPVSVTENGSSIIAVPHDGTLISFTIDYDNPFIGSQHFTFKLTDTDYIKEIAPARTFCLKSEAEELVNKGLVKGGSVKNALVVDSNGVIENELRFKDEFVRHKILDLIGDLTCLGGSVNAHIIAFKSGHEENIKLMRKISDLQDTTMLQKRVETLIDIREIFDILPHRYPLLLIDRVIELDGYNRAVGIKNVTINEPFFQGHFPGQPIMPGVLVIESMAQLAGALLMRKSGNVKRLPVLLSLENVKLRKTVIPGDQLRIEVQTVKIRSRTGEIYGRALVDGQVAAEGTMKFMLIEESPF